MANVARENARSRMLRTGNSERVTETVEFWIIISMLRSEYVFMCMCEYVVAFSMLLEECDASFMYSGACFVMEMFYGVFISQCIFAFDFDVKINDRNVCGFIFLSLKQKKIITLKNSYVIHLFLRFNRGWEIWNED